MKEWMESPGATVRIQWDGAYDCDLQTVMYGLLVYFSYCIVSLI